MKEPLLPNQQCYLCNHFEGKIVTSRAADGQGRQAYSCKAFTEGIPDDFILSNHDHTKPYPGDHGVLWEPAATDVEPSWSPW